MSIGCQVSVLEWPLEEEVYVKQPPGFRVSVAEQKAYSLQKGIIWP